MVVILSTSQIVQKTIEFFRNAQPLLDTKPGTVARDLFIDAPAIRLSELYDELGRVSSAQSISKSVGTDLDNLFTNFSSDGRLQPGRAIGPAIFTFSSILTDIPLPSGSLVYSKNGVNFRIVSTVVVSSSDQNRYRAVATKIQADLDYLNITDQFAVEVLVESTITGTRGNISKYSLLSTNISGISHVTNIVPFTGGTPAENDTAYKNRILSVFSGSNTGTELGFANIVATDPAVLGSVVVGPGDPLMIRDNTVLEVDANGNYVLDENGDPIIVSEGDGGKVDIFVYGTRVTETSDSTIYNDKSGKGDPTNSLNDFVLGQIAGFENASMNKKRRELVKNKNLPAQPVFGILEVTGTRSGTFSQQIIDTFGVSTGNYSLLKDTAGFAGSPFGMDKLHWVSNFTEISGEDETKGVFNGQDKTSYSDVISISNIRRTVSITNENSTIDASDRSILYLNHVPVRNIIKVLNLTTGERYVVSNRNPDGTEGALNITGKIIISGNTLPSISDILQVDYEWIYYHDTYFDFDSKVINDNIRTSTDSIDWGYTNQIPREQSSIQINSGVASATVTLPISSVISVNKIAYDAAKIVVQNAMGLFQISGLTSTITNVISVKRISDGAELFNTHKKNGYFDGSNIVLPTDSPAIAGDLTDVYYNAQDIFTISGVSGSFNSNTITLLPAAISTYGLSPGDLVEVNYIANINELLPTANLSALPATKNVNKFNTLTQTSIGWQPLINVYSGSIVTKNLKKSPSRLGITFAGIAAPGVLSIKGTTTKLIDGVIFVATLNGFTQDLTQAIRNGLGLASTASLPSTMKVTKLVSLKKVETAAQDTVVTSVLNSYDITGYKLKDASFSLDEAAYDTLLTNYKVTIPSTANNSSNAIFAGDRLLISFYVTTSDITENISVSTNGVQYTENSFSFVDQISISSGFKVNNVYSGTINVFSMNQPITGSRYKIGYKYTSPKPGERITIRYNYNSLINDSTLRLATNKPITADVLIKEASYILVDVSTTITVTKAFVNSKKLVAQNVADQISNTINGLSLGAAINPSDIVNSAYQVNGLDSITVLKFNKSGQSGQVSVLQALRNQYMRANNITVTYQ